jgi:hypothetical protein
LPIFDVARITSGSNTQVDSINRQNAVQKAINKAQDLPGTQDAVVIGNQPGGIWPMLTPYTNDTSGGLFVTVPFNTVPPPQFIWDSDTFGQGETRYFAVAVELEDTEEHVVSVTTFADNAHRMFVEEWTPEGNLVTSITPPEGLFDGPMTANASEDEDKESPFNWQRIRIWSKDGISTGTAGNFLVISWEVLNYNTTDTVNPAGLAFQADIYKYVTD